MGKKRTKYNKLGRGGEEEDTIEKLSLTSGATVHSLVSCNKLETNQKQLKKHRAARFCIIITSTKISDTI